MKKFEYKKLFPHREVRLQIIDKLKFIPDELYLKIVYWIKTGEKLNLKNPVGFNEKLNWLKLNDIHPEYTNLANKISVRKHIAEKIGEEFLIPLLGSWEHFDDIDFNSLPDKFVLKCSHDSGSVKLIEKKDDIDRNALRSFFEGRLKINPFNMGREYPYKDIPPRIIAEKFMVSTDGKGINDYKFFCFDGVPKIMFVATDRAIDVKFDFFDMDFNHLPIWNIHDNADNPVVKPENFEEMKNLAVKLSQGMKFVRIDLYEINGKIYFGEYTFFHGGGFYLFSPPEWEKKLGSWLNIKSTFQK